MSLLPGVLYFVLVFGAEFILGLLRAPMARGGRPGSRR